MKEDKFYKEIKEIDIILDEISDKVDKDMEELKWVK